MELKRKSSAKVKLEHKEEPENHYNVEKEYARQLMKSRDKKTEKMRRKYNLEKRDRKMS